MAPLIFFVLGKVKSRQKPLEIISKSGSRDPLLLMISSGFCLLFTLPKTKKIKGAISPYYHGQRKGCDTICRVITHPYLEVIGSRGGCGWDTNVKLVLNLSV